MQDERGRAVAGATVSQWEVDGRPVPGLLSATTGADGRFLIGRIPHHEWLRGGAANRPGLNFTVSHPDFPKTQFVVQTLPRNVAITLKAGCRVTGTVTDSVTGRPAAGALVVAERLSEFAETPAAADAAGRFMVVLDEDRYNFSARAPDRVSVALTDRECLAGETVELPALKLETGGFIAGTVIDASTGAPIAGDRRGEPIALSLFGPSRPMGKTIASVRMAWTDSAGRFVIRAAPGDNFPYLVNFQADRMAWNTTEQAAVKVKSGETTRYDMLVTPKVSPEEKLPSTEAGRVVLEGPGRTDEPDPG